MKLLVLLLPLITLIAIMSCKSQKIDLSKNEEAKIFFGSGGGFAGTSKQYCLVAGGDLYKKESIHGDWKRIHKGKSEDAQSYFTTIDSINIKEITVNTPGNHYRYVEYETSEYNHRVTWGRNPDDVPQELKNLYQELHLFVKNTTHTDK